MLRGGPGGIDVIAEHARRQRNRLSTWGCHLRHSVKVEKCDRPGLAFIQDCEVGLPQPGHGVTFLIEYRDRDFYEPRARAKHRCWLLPYYLGEQ